MARARLRRLEFEDVGGFVDTAMIHEAKEDFFREIAETTVKPVLSRLRQVYTKYGRRVPWNAIVAVGMKIYSMAKKGYDLDYYALAEALGRKWNLPKEVTNDIVDAVLAESK